MPKQGEILKPLSITQKTFSTAVGHTNFTFFLFDIYKGSHNSDKLGTNSKSIQPFLKMSPTGYNS